MKILEMRSENVKRLTVVQITPEGALVQVTGANAAGKSSVLDSIELALDAAGAEQSKPIRRGAKTAVIRTVLGETGEPKLIVERRFTEKGSDLKVSAPDGARYSSPQKLIDGLVGALSFDPADFMRRDSKAQFETMRKIVHVPIDLDELDKQRAAIFDLRTQTNRAIKALQAQVAGVAVPDGLPDEAPDRKAILQRLVSVDEHNAAVRAHQRSVEFARSSLANAVTEHTEALRALETLKERHMAEFAELQRRQAREQAEAIAEEDTCGRVLDQARLAVEKKDAEVTPELQDPDAIRAELDAADRTLDGIARRNTKQALELDLAEEQREAERLTITLAQIDNAKVDAIANTKMPIEGLSFADGAVLFNGLPLNQASSAEQLRVSAAIGAALNPKLRVMLCRDGSLLDRKSLAALTTFAEEHDFQIWCERVDETGEVGIVIEDGHVKGQEELVLAFEKEQAEAAKPTETVDAV